MWIRVTRTLSCIRTSTSLDAASIWYSTSTGNIGDASNDNITHGYDHQDSKAVRDGKFIGLIIVKG